jgi:hypothetical protein
MAALEVFGWIESSHDTRVEIGRALSVEEAVHDLWNGNDDVATLDI